MATANCTLTYVRTMDRGTNDSSAAYHFGYGNSGQRWVTCYKVTIPSYTGTPSGITFSFSVNRGTAYPTDKNSTWKIGLDEQAPVWSEADGAYTAGSVYANGNYANAGSYTNTFSGTITSSTSSFTSTFSSNSALFDSGNILYVYFYSGSSSSNSIKLTSVSATVSYTTETVTGTNLVVGTTSSPSATTAYPTPSKRTVYWGVSGLQSQIKNYTGFHLYLSSGFSFTQGQTSAPTGTKIASYSSSTSTATSFTQSFTVPSSNFKIGKNTGIVCVAQNASGYWRIGGSSNSPKVCYINLKATTWFRDAIAINIKEITKSSVTYTIKLNGYNSPRYLEYVDYCKGQTSVSGSNTEVSYGSKRLSFSSSTSSSTTGDLTISGLSAGTQYTHYFTADSTTSYATYGYYGLNSVTLTTDDDYSGDNAASVAGSTTATISCTLNSIINLDGKIYYSTSSGLTSKPSTYVSYDGNNKGEVSLTELSSGTSYIYYFYVYSSESGILYSVGSISFTTDNSSYSAVIEANVTGSTTATVSISNLSSNVNLDSNWYLSTESDVSSLLNKYFTCTTTTSLPVTYSQQYDYSYEATINGGTYYLEFDEDIPSGTTLTLDSDSNGNPTTSNGIWVYTSQSSNTKLSSTKLTFITVTDSSSTNMISADRNNTIELSDMNVCSTITYYAYVYSSASGNYYQVGSITFNTHSYIYYADSNGNLIPCWTYILNSSTGELEKILLDIPNYIS